MEGFRVDPRVSSPEAQAVYRADKGYQPLVADFPEVASVAADETRHGDLVSGLLKK